MSSVTRRRAHRIRGTGGHFPDPAFPATPADWPPGRRIAEEVDLDALAAAAVAALTADDVLASLRQMPLIVRQAVIAGTLGMRRVAVVNRGMAARLLARMRAGGSTTRIDLLHDLTSPLVIAFMLYADPAIWSAVLGDDDGAALRAVASSPGLGPLLDVAADISAALVTGALVAAIAKDAPASAVALATLAVDHPAARSAHDALRTGFPRLPDVPTRSLPGLVPRTRRCAAALVEEGGNRDDCQNDRGCGAYHLTTDSEIGVEEDREMLMSDGTGDDIPAGSPRSGGEGVEDDAGQRASQVLKRWDEALRAALSVADALRAGQLPACDLADEVAAHARHASVAARRLGDELGAAIDPSRDGLRDALAELRERHRRQTEEAAWIDRLTRLEGPADLADLITGVRTAATAAQDDPAVSREPLAALWRFLGVDDDKRSARRRVDWAELSAARAARPTAPTPVPESTSADAAAPLDDAEPADQAEPTDQAEPADQAEPVDEPDPTDEADPGLAGLAALLARGHGAALASISGGQARPATGGSPDDHRTDSPAPDVASARSDSDPAAAHAAVADADTTAPAIAPIAVPAADDARREASGPGGAQVTELAEALLGRDRFGLAADLLEAAGAPTAGVAARRLAACAVALRAPAGPLASAFADIEPQVSREALGDDRAGQLLALLAAARIALLAPSAGPARVLAKLLPCVSGQPNLSEALSALAEASRCGVVMLAEAADAVGTLAAAETVSAELATEAAALLSGAPRRTFKYVPANGVYQAWMRPDGELGAMLTLVAANNPDAASQARDLVVGLRGKAYRSIESTFAGQRRNKSNQIVAGARDNLAGRWDEAVELAGRWAECAERVLERRATTVGNWHTAALAKLHNRLKKVREPALDELAGVSDRPAVAGAARRLFGQALAICDGDVPVADEPPVAYAAHGELLASALLLDARTLLPDGGLPALPDAGRRDLGRLAQAERRGPRDVYDQRAGRGDHDLTAVLIAGLRRAEPELAAELERRRGVDIQRQSRQIRHRVDELSDRIATRRLDGSLDDQPWAALAARAEALRDSSRQDFGRVQSAIDEIATDLDRQRDEAIARTVARIHERAGRDQNVAQVAELLVGRALGGQVASAEESLETVTAGGRLPSAGSTGARHLRAFLATVPALADERSSEPLDLVYAALTGSNSAAQARMAQLGLDTAGLSDARRDAGRKALGAWRALARRGNDRNIRRDDTVGALRLVLAQAGLEFAQVRLQQAPAGQTGRHWVTLKDVRGTGEALTPALGSAMSPDGATLSVVLVRSSPTPATLIEWMAVAPHDQTVLALWLAGVLSPADRRAIANAARGRPRPPLFLLDEACLAYLVCQQEPRRATFAATALPFTAASPYRDTPGEIAPEMFYGRTDELAAVLDLRGSSFVSGGRQLGKSALLRIAAREFTRDRPGHEAVGTTVFTVGADGRPELLWGTLWPKLAELRIVDGAAPPARDLAAAVHAAILRWLRAEPTRALLILLDEADAFLDADAAGNRFTHVDWCRRIMLDSDRRAKVVFAGLHTTARFESLPNQPLSHLGRPISVGPLRPQHAHELLTKPLAALGFTFADEDALPARILARANNLPALLQLFGEALVRHLTAREVPPDGPPQLITAEDVDDVFGDAELAAAFRKKYVMTLHLDPRYLVITYSVAFAAHERGIDASLSLAELSDEARQHWPAGFRDVGSDGFAGLVTECVDLGVLALDQGRYRLRTPTVRRLLGTADEVFDTLSMAPQQLAVPSVSDAASYRRRIKDLIRSPLTERQIGRLFDARRTVLTITGSTALWIDRVHLALEQAHAETAGLVRAVQRCAVPTPDGVRGSVARATDATLVLVDARDAPTSALRALLAAAETAVAAATPDVAVAVVTAPPNAAAWVGHPGRVDLARMDEPGLRLWCDEDGLPFRDEQARSQLLARTGGWPMALAQVARRAASEGSAAGHGRLLDGLDEWLSAKGGRDLVRAAGLDASAPALAAVFRAAVDLCGAAGADPHVVASVLEEDPDLVARASDAGFAALDEVVAALTALGCLLVDDAGLLRPEPVLADRLPPDLGARP
ncbi:conserved hypothetical protein [Frankia canadensis]|uniref:Uncharacterized protein n=1 Tax=Frankia canadensis TaxID=1836972 RepID=A0A2I2KLM5_9ACTN|nr:hypothetical protein [Frankia canadensis]SNQ46546.1 conserved hypothetical protein [Frankia canadensis]SOU53836.1 conserved hypothetical protein [Frankia canadensis]